MDRGEYPEVSEVGGRGVQEGEYSGRVEEVVVDEGDPEERRGLR